MSAPAKPRLEFPGWPHYDEEQAQAAHDIILSNQVNYHTGKRGKAFEKEFAEAMGTSYGVACSNGSVAIELALIGLGLQPGDEVVTTPRTFLASSSSCLLQDVRPVYADVDPDSGNITAKTIEAVLTPKTRAILPVHLGGWPCEMDAIMALAQEKGLHVIEDCAQAHGARYRGKSVGSLGDANPWSFCQDKIMTTGGEGGFVTCNDEDVWRRIWSFKDHGKDHHLVYHAEHPPGFRWLHASVGTNWRMTEVQAEIGRIQLRRLPEWRAARQRNAQVVMGRLGKLDAIRMPQVPDHMEHAQYRWYFYVRPEALKDGWDRDRIMVEAGERGVPIYSGSCGEIYLEKAIQDAGCAPAEPLPITRKIWGNALTLLTHPNLTEGHMHQMCDVVEALVREGTR